MSENIFNDNSTKILHGNNDYLKYSMDTIDIGQNGDTPNFEKKKNPKQKVLYLPKILYLNSKNSFTDRLINYSLNLYSKSTVISAGTSFLKICYQQTTQNKIDKKDLDKTISRTLLAIGSNLFTNEITKIDKHNNVISVYDVIGGIVNFAIDKKNNLK